MSTLFCRHNRFTADCPICSKGTVLEGTPRQSPRRSSSGASGSRRAAPEKRTAPQFSGPHVASGPLEWPEGGRYEVRLERVPGGVRLGAWSQGSLERRAPMMPAAELRSLLQAARERDLLPAHEVAALVGALELPAEGTASSPTYGGSPGRSGEMRDELRVERLPDGLLRVARWRLRPGADWELHDSAPMLPAARYAEALSAAARAGLLLSGNAPSVRP